MTTANQQLVLMAHQGFQGELPSNSLGAIVDGMQYADAVEFDVYVTRAENGDDHVICVHPESYFLYYNKAGMVNTEPFPLTYEQSQEVFVRGTKLMPSLRQVLEQWIELGCKAELQIELKGPDVPAALIPLLHEFRARADFAFEKVMLTGLCYPNDRHRITESRRLCTDVRLALPMRGANNFAADGFDGIDDVLAFSEDWKVEMVTIHRKHLSEEILGKLQATGIVTGTFHGRTSDEIEAALSLGVRYLAVDMFQGKLLGHYPHVRPEGAPLFRNLMDTGFYFLRDHLWELGWQLEKTTRAMTQEAVDLNPDADATCSVYSNGRVTLELFDAAENSTTGAVSLTNQQVPLEFFSDLEKESLGNAPTWKQVVSHQALLNTVTLYSTALPFMDSWMPESVEEVVQCAEWPEDGNFSPAQHELAIEVLVRHGRLLGVLAFTALNPRHSVDRELRLDANGLVSYDSWLVLRGAREQIEAQLFRSGRKALVRFENVVRG